MIATGVAFPRASETDRAKNPGLSQTFHLVTAENVAFLTRFRKSHFLGLARTPLKRRQKSANRLELPPKQLFQAFLKTQSRHKPKLALTRGITPNIILFMALRGEQKELFS